MELPKNLFLMFFKFFKLVEARVEDYFFITDKYCMTQSKRDQPWHFFTLANRPYFFKMFVLLASFCTVFVQYHLILYKSCILSFWNFTPSFLWLLKCSKKNLTKWTWKQEKKTKIFVFNRFWIVLPFWKAWKIYFKKMNRLIVSSINRFFVNFSSIFRVLAKKGC
jgi:hypothetical protein